MDTQWLKYANCLLKKKTLTTHSFRLLLVLHRLVHHRGRRVPQSEILPRTGSCRYCLGWAWCRWSAGPRRSSGCGDPRMWSGWWPGPGDQTALNKKTQARVCVNQARGMQEMCVRSSRGSSQPFVVPPRTTQVDRGMVLKIAHRWWDIVIAQGCCRSDRLNV